MFIKETQHVNINLTPVNQLYG